MKKKNKVLGNLSTFQTLLVQCLQVYLEDPDTSSDATGMALISILSVLFTNLALANTVKEVLTSLAPPLTQLYKHAASETPTFTPQLLGKVGFHHNEQYVFSREMISSFSHVPPAVGKASGGCSGLPADPVCCGLQ